MAWLMRCCMVLAASAWAAVSACAQTYPVRPVRMILPFPPGGPNDIYGRLVAQRLSETFGRQVVIDNRGGASGIIGAEIAARAAPDGYTLFFGGAGSLAINPALHRKLPYDPLRDFAPISLIAKAPFLLVTHPALPVKTVAELIALARAKPGQLNFASAGASGPPRLAAELFKSMSGIDLVHVPYTGGGPATAAIVGGQVQLFFAGTASALPFVREGRLRGLAVTSLQRSQAAPEFPTVAEAGLSGYEIVSWFAVLAPAGTPAGVLGRLNEAVVATTRAPDVRQRFIDAAADPVGSTARELAAYTQSELGKWSKIVQLAGIAPE